MTCWYIMQVVPSRTIQLATALPDAGVEAWTPVETVRGEPPKLKEFEKPRPRRKVPEFITRPLLPSIVFARAEHLAQLIEMARAPVQTYQVWDPALRRLVLKGYPFFRIFRPDARPIEDRELAHLRKLEGRRKPRGSVKVWKPGDRVRMTEGAYGGLRGVVVAVKKKSEITVRIAGSIYEFDVQAWILIPDEIAGLK
jgi:transcription antitermination factor NusG